MKGKYLITTDAWFYAPDGKKYRAVWGEVQIMKDDVLGVDTNRNTSNWYAYIGSDQKGVVVAGCQIHCAVKCEKPPNISPVMDCNYGNGFSQDFERPTEIYLGE